MGWGTAYKYEGYLNRITKREIDDKIEELKEDNATMWREILAYMAQTPPATTPDVEGDPIDYPEFLASKAEQYQRQMEENYRLLTHLEDCKETLQEKPENVEED